jgi:hypothetical protein
MKVKPHRKPLIVLGAILILFVLAFFIYPYKTGLVFNVKRITYSDMRLVNEYFKLNVQNNSYIKKCSIEKDSYPFDYVMDVKLIIPEEDINKTFINYKSMQKLTEESQGWYGSQLFADWGIGKNNFDYEYKWFEDARRNNLFGLGYIQTQKSPIIIFTEPVNGKVSIFMTRDKLGWD